MTRCSTWPPATATPRWRPPAAWGTETRLVELFGPHASNIRTERKQYMFRYLSAAHWIDLFRRFYGPLHKAFAALDAAGQQALHAALVELLERHNRRGRDTLLVPSESLEVVIERA